MPSATGNTPTAAAVLHSVDRAAFVAALLHRLRAAGVDSGLPSAETFARALQAQTRLSRVDLYWLARVTLTHRHSDLQAFDAVFAAVFEDASLQLDPHGRRSPTASPSRPDDVFAPVSRTSDDRQDGSGLPWATLPAVTRESQDSTSPVGIPQRLPSSLSGLADTPFTELSPEELELVGAWLETGFSGWPIRRTRRLHPDTHGRYVDLRATVARARRTGWEPIHLVRTAPRDKPRRVVMLCDVSQSMQAQATPLLHLMRAAVLAADAEVFAFATSLTRLTPVLAHRSVSVAIELATDTVVDRFGGTRIASNLRQLLRSRHAGLLRGAVVIIASDGWDSDEPEALAASMARVQRRAHLVIWLNPRVAAVGFAPLVGSMAAALPYCDALLPAHNLHALGQALDAVGNARGRGAIISTR